MIKIQEKSLRRRNQQVARAELKRMMKTAEIALKFQLKNG